MLSNQTQISIIQKIEEQVRRRLSDRGSKKTFKDSLERLLRKVTRSIFCNLDLPIGLYQKSSRLGADELGRDVEAGTKLYAELLMKRKIHVHTVIVLGSRAKRSWRPQSDVDVTIIATGLPSEGTNALTKRLYGLSRRLLLSDRPICLGIEPSGCCSKEEFLVRMCRFDITALDAVLYGVVVFDDGFWKEVQEKYSKITLDCGLTEMPLKDLIRPL